MKRLGTYKLVPRTSAQWYFARGWEVFDLGAHHAHYSVGVYKGVRP